MKIVALDTFAVDIPYDFGAPTQGFGAEDWNSLSIVLIRLQSDDGATGWGEAFSYNCVEAVMSVVNKMIAPLVIGQTVTDINDFNSTLQQKLHLFGRYGITMFAISGVDIALWDLAAKQANVSLAKLLKPESVDQIEGYASLFRYQDREAVVGQASAAVQQGYRRVKLHEIGLDEMRAARTALGDHDMMLDVNCPWSEAEVHALLPALSELNPYWLEEPIFPPEDFDALARLNRQSTIAIAAGENACTAVEFQRMIDTNAVSFCQPSVTKVGGVTEFIKIAAAVAKSELQLMPHSPYFGPGFLATLQLSAALAPDTLLERFFATAESGLYGHWTDPKQGVFRVPDGPGLGVELDENVLREYAMKL